MNKVTQLLLCCLVVLQCSISIAMEQQSAAPVSVGDLLLTRQPSFDFHVGVVVWAPKNATMDSLEEVVLADHAPRKEGQGPDGVRFVWLKDFILDGVFHSFEIPEHEKSRAFLIVARAVSALFTNAAYDIAQKNCGGFAEWCTNGALSGFADFRRPESLSFNREMRKFRKWCDGTPEGKQKIIESLREQNIKEESIAMVEKFPVQSLAYFGQGCKDGEVNLVQFIKATVNESITNGASLAVNSSDPKTMPSLASIVSSAFSLDRDFLRLTDNAWAQLSSMNDEEAIYLCSRIVDEDVLGNLVDVGQLIEEMVIWKMINKTKAKL